MTRGLPGAAGVKDAVRPAVVAYRHRGLRADDLLLAAYPKSGSTWLRFVLAGALAGREMDFDLVHEVSPPLGAHRTGPAIVPGGGRLVKSHEVPRFVGGRRHLPRVVLLVRDGRDVGISFFHHLRGKRAVGDDFSAYWDRYVAGTVSGFGSWQQHARAWLEYGRRNDVLTIRYEDLLDDPRASLDRINETFALGLSDAAIGSALSASTPDGMRRKEATSRFLEARRPGSATAFVREAKAGGWRDELDPALRARFEAAAGPELAEFGYPLSSDLD